MGFFTKDKPRDTYKKINKIIKSMYYLKKRLIINADCFSNNDRNDIISQVNDIIDYYNDIMRMEYKYHFTQSQVMLGSGVVDYEGRYISTTELLNKVVKEIEIIKRIAKGAPVLMSEINPNSIPKDFFYDEHKLGVRTTLYVHDPDHELPPMFLV